MRRKDLSGLPAVELPPGYSLRTSGPGDDAAWAVILGEAFGERRWTAEDFRKTMVEDPAYRPDRIFFVVDPAGVPCATASAYRHPPWGDRVGYVHYVAVRPSHAGWRLGYAVSLAVLHQFVAEGCPWCVLTTDDWRLPAIKTYLRLGFAPFVRHASHPDRWRAVFARLGAAAPEAFDRAPPEYALP